MQTPLRRQSTDTLRFKYALLALLTISLMGHRLFAQDSNPCEQIACSGQGTCVMVDNRPVCSCNQGFVPDSETQLTCIPYDVAMRLKSSESQAQPVTAEPVNQELHMVEQILGRDDLDLSFEDFKKDNPNVHYAWFWYKHYEKRKKFGALLITLASISFSAGIAGLVVGAVLASEFTPVGVIGMVVAGISYSLGLPIYILSRKNMNRLERLKPENNVSSISPSIVVNKTRFGIGMNVTF